MATNVDPATSPVPPHRVGLTVVLLIVGLLGHVVAAREMGGYRLAYIHHVLGFFFIALVTGLLMLGVGWLLWRGRRRPSLLAFSAVQAALGIAVMLGQRYH